MSPRIYILLLVCLTGAACSNSRSRDLRSDTSPSGAGNESEAPTEARVLPSPPLILAEPSAQPDTFAGREMRTMRPDELVSLAYQSRAQGNRFAELVYQYWSVANGGGSQYNLACAYALNNQVDAAFYWLQRAAHEDGVDAAHADVDPDLKVLRADKRWKTVAAYLRGCCDYWRDSGVHEEILILPALQSQSESMPILIGLHGKGTSATEFNSRQYDAWARQLNMAVLLVSGTEPTGPKSFVWSSSPERNAQRIEQALQNVSGRLNTGAPRILFGFSQGATAAVEVAVRDPAHYAGAISMSAGADLAPKPSQYTRAGAHARQ